MKQTSKKRSGRGRTAGVPGPVGWDPAAQGLDRHSGVVPVGALGVGGTRVVYYTTIAEFVALLIALLHPLIAKIGRADMSDIAARNRASTGPLGPRVAIRYVWEGKVHWYLPDLAGLAADACSVIIEAGIGAKKGTPEELAKLEAARAWATAMGGQLWVIAADLVPGRWVRGALALYLATFDYRGDESLLAEIRALWEAGRATIQELIARFAPRYDAPTVSAAARKVAGELLREGRLDVDLAKTVITYTTRIGARAANLPPLEPPGIIRDLAVLRQMAEEGADDALEDAAPADRPDVDPDTIVDPETRDAFLRRRAAMAEILGGTPAARAAHNHGLDPRRMQQLAVAYREHGERALLPYAVTSSPVSGLKAAMAAKIGERFRASERPTIQAIVDDAAIHALATELGMKRGPTRYQVAKVVGHLRRTDQATRQARAGRKLVPLAITGRAVTTEYVPGIVCEFDEATLDVKVLALAEAETTVRLHIGFLIDVATRYPLSVVVSPKALDQWDLRRAVLRALLPDDEFRARFGIRKVSPLSGLIPCLIRTDNGKIEASRLAVQMAGDTPFVLEWAPRGDAHAKPVVESMFDVLNDRGLHRICITTKGNPEARGAHDPDAAARQKGIDADRFERFLMKLVYDVYAIEWHGGLLERPQAVAEDAATRFPLRRFMGTPDEARRALRRDEGTRLVDRHGVSYKGEWYGAEFLGDRLGTRVRIKVDEDDVRTLDVYDLEGAFLGSVRCDRVASRFGRAVSRWELDLERMTDAQFAKAAHEEANERRDEATAELESPAETGAKQVAKAARRRHHGRRAAETATTPEAITNASDVPAAPTRSVPPTLALPAADDTDYDALVDPADAA